jgi:UTP-glucose-1-phosphate uridylyltransferase
MKVPKAVIPAAGLGTRFLPVPEYGDSLLQIE